MILEKHFIERDGKKFVEISRKAFDKLMERLEDLEDLIAIRNAKAKKEESFPIRLYDSIDNGEHPIRVFREYRQLSVKKLANQAGISEAYLSQIECGLRKGTMKTLKKLLMDLKFLLKK